MAFDRFSGNQGRDALRESGRSRGGLSEQAWLDAFTASIDAYRAEHPPLDRADNRGSEGASDGDRSATDRGSKTGRTVAESASDTDRTDGRSDVDPAVDDAVAGTDLSGRDVPVQPEEQVRLDASTAATDPVGAADTQSRAAQANGDESERTDEGDRPATQAASATGRAIANFASDVDGADGQSDSEPLPVSDALLDLLRSDEPTDEAFLEKYWQLQEEAERSVSRPTNPGSSDARTKPDVVAPPDDAPRQIVDAPVEAKEVPQTASDRLSAVTTYINRPDALAKAATAATEHPRVQETLRRAHEAGVMPKHVEIELPIAEILGPDGHEHCEGYRFVAMSDRPKPTRNEESHSDQPARLAVQLPERIESFEGGKIRYVFRSNTEPGYELSSVNPIPKDERES